SFSICFFRMAKMVQEGLQRGGQRSQRDGKQGGTEGFPDEDRHAPDLCDPLWGTLFQNSTQPARAAAGRIDRRRRGETPPAGWSGGEQSVGPTTSHRSMHESCRDGSWVTDPILQWTCLSLFLAPPAT